MNRILIILKKENGPRASSAPALGLNTIIFKHVYWYMQQTQVSVYRTIGPLVLCFSRIGEDLEECLPNLESLILTNNSLQELGDLDTLATLKNLKYLR